MRAKSAFAIGAITAAFFGLSSCIVGVGDWERFSKDFHSSYPLKPSGRLSVETFNGSVDISGWDQDMVDISGVKFGPSQAEADNLKVDIDAGPESVSIRVPRPSMRRNNQGARLVIKIPRGARLDRITTSNSSILAQDGAGPARLHSSNGSIRVMDLRGDLEAETSNSSIELEGVNGDSRIHTSNGHIRAGRLGGMLEAHTSNGSVHADIARPDKAVRIDTSNGGVDLSLPPNFSSPVHVETNNGSITLRMAPGTNARLSARTSNSSINTEFEVRAQGELSHNRLDGVIGSGGPLIELVTSNSSIHVLKR
jgi:DUF4097 and DUF4098 domain-containing protein YvlB